MHFRHTKRDAHQDTPRGKETRATSSAKGVRQTKTHHLEEDEVGECIIVSSGQGWARHFQNKNALHGLYRNSPSTSRPTENPPQDDYSPRVSRQSSIAEPGDAVLQAREAILALESMSPLLEKSQTSQRQNDIPIPQTPSSGRNSPPSDASFSSEKELSQGLMDPVEDCSNMVLETSKPTSPSIVFPKTEELSEAGLLVSSPGPQQTLNQWPNDPEILQEMEPSPLNGADNDPQHILAQERYSPPRMSIPPIEIRPGGMSTDQPSSDDSLRPHLTSQPRNDLPCNDGLPSLVGYFSLAQSQESQGFDEATSNQERHSHHGPVHIASEGSPPSQSPLHGYMAVKDTLSTDKVQSDPLVPTTNSTSSSKKRRYTKKTRGSNKRLQKLAAGHFVYNLDSGNEVQSLISGPSTSLLGSGEQPRNVSYQSGSTGTDKAQPSSSLYPQISHDRLPAPTSVDGRFQPFSTRQSPIAPHSASSSVAPAGNNALYHHHTSPGQSSDAPPQSSAKTYEPARLDSTIDNRVEQPPLQEAQVHTFTTSASLVLAFDHIAGETNGHPAKSYPVNVLMWQSLPDFNNWFSQNAKMVVPALKIELLDVHWQAEKTFVVSQSDLECFRAIKQIIWDLFWVAYNTTVKPFAFRILISPSLPDGRKNHQGYPQLASTGTDKTASPHQSALPTADSQPSHRLAPMPAPGNSHSGDFPQPTLNAANHMTAPLPGGVTVPSSVDQDIEPASEVANTQAGYTQLPRCNAVNDTTTHPHAKPIAPSPLGQRVASVPCMGNISYVDSQPSTMKGVNASSPHQPNTPNLGHDFSSLNSLPGKSTLPIGSIVNAARATTALPPRQVFAMSSCSREAAAVAEPPGNTQSQSGGASMSKESSNSATYPSQVVPPINQSGAAFSSPSLEAQNPHMQQPTAPAPTTTEVVIRLQMNSTGKFSGPYAKAVLRPKITNCEFFAWFASQTGHGDPAGPTQLRFTFKDAMPTPKTNLISRGNDDHFTYMRRDAKEQCEKAQAYLPGLKEFVVLVTVPGWTSPAGQEQDDEWW